MAETDITGTSPGESPGGWYFHSGTVGKILAAGRDGKAVVRLSLDLNISERDWEIKDGILVLEKGAEQQVGIALDALEPVLGSENKVFRFNGICLDPVEVRADGYYKLVPTASVPTLEINGVKMHRSKDIDPTEDARRKTALVVKPGDIVLDTCGGLGYSAVFAVRAGARRVVSTEKSRAVLKIRALNPWTRPLGFSWLTREALGKVELEHGDICRRIQEFEDRTFDAVLHDPPRFTSATGDLYGRVFYSHLARVLKPSGRLFHYTGSPQRIKNGTRFVANAAKRLEAAGFTHVVFNNDLQGLCAVTPRA